VAAEYSAIRDVDPSTSVDEFKAHWATLKRVDVDPAFITLRLVKCGSGKPGASEEAAAAALDDPSVTLREARLAPVSWLTADFEDAPAAAAATGACARPHRVAARAPAPDRARAQRTQRRPGFLPRR
jgi:hypothetical protein